MTFHDDLRMPSGRTIASFFLLPDCLMACRFCGSARRFDTLSQGESEALLEAVAERGIRSVVLGGGEPLLWPHDLDGLMARARELGIHVQLCTSGLHLPADPALWPRAEGIILPLEAMDSRIHDRLRRGPESHHRQVLSHLEALVASGTRITVSTVVTKENLAELPRIGAHLDGLAARGLHLHAWHLYRFIPFGRGGARNREALGISMEAYQNAAKAEQAVPRPYRVYRRSDLRHPSTVVYLWKERGEVRIA